MLSALIFLLLKIFLTEWVIRYSGHLSCRCSYDSNRENVDSVKSLYDNRSYYREHLSHCSNIENGPGRVLERSCSPPPAPWLAQLFQVIPARGCFNLRSTHVHGHYLHLLWQTAVALSYPKPVLFNLNLPCGTFKTLSSHPVILQYNFTNVEPVIIFHLSFLLSKQPQCSQTRLQDHGLLNFSLAASVLVSNWNESSWSKQTRQNISPIDLLCASCCEVAFSQQHNRTDSGYVLPHALRHPRAFTKKRLSVPPFPVLYSHCEFYYLNYLFYYYFNFFKIIFNSSCVLQLVSCTRQLYCLVSKLLNIE